MIEYGQTSQRSEGCTRDAASSSVERDADTEAEDAKLKAAEAARWTADRSQVELRLGPLAFRVREIEDWLTRRCRYSRNQARRLIAEAKARLPSTDPTK